MASTSSLFSVAKCFDLKGSFSDQWHQMHNRKYEQLVIIFRISIQLLQGDQKVSVHLTITIPT